MSFIIHCRSRMAVELEVNGTGQGRWGCLGRSFQPLALIASAAEEGVSKTEAWLTERASPRYWERQLQSGWAEAQWLQRLCSPTQVLIHSFICLPPIPSPRLAPICPPFSNPSSSLFQGFLSSSSHSSPQPSFCPPSASFFHPSSRRSSHSSLYRLLQRAYYAQGPILTSGLI